MQLDVHQKSPMSCWRNARQLKRFYTRNAIVHSKSIKYIKQDVGGVLAAVAAVGAVGGVVKMYLDALPSSMRKEDAVLILHEMKLAAAEVAVGLKVLKRKAYLLCRISCSRPNIMRWCRRSRRGKSWIKRRCMENC